MKVTGNKIWTWYLPNEPKTIQDADWERSGGKWIVFDGKDRINALAEALQLYIAQATSQAPRAGTAIPAPSTCIAWTGFEGEPG